MHCSCCGRIIDEDEFSDPSEGEESSICANCYYSGACLELDDDDLEEAMDEDFDDEFEDFIFERDLDENDIDQV